MQRIRRRAELLGEIRRLVADRSLSDTAFREAVISLLNPEADAAPSTRAADVREILCRNCRRIRPLIELLVKLNLQAVSGDECRRALEWLREIYADGDDQLWTEPPLEWAGRWRPLVQSDVRKLGLRAYEAATLRFVRRSLRNGSLWSPYGQEFSDPACNLMPVTVWQKEAHGYQFRKNLPGGLELAQTRPYRRVGRVQFPILLLELDACRGY